ncbi:PepSY domain-containing protein [Nocardioides dongkuii]|uniref:PepSY domain-containing protein n=1 Tax=Nocardioides dongkuii TaxID=2760089 RepID=UPI001877EDDE|nr:PepSY domain-containing protein [Nocardioides dongkuii]
MSIGRNARTSVLAALIAGPLALGLVACGDDDDGGTGSSAESSATPTPTPTPTPASPTDASPTDASPTSAAPAGDDAVVLAAATTAADAVPGGRLYSLDQVPQRWEAEVVDRDGRLFDLTVGGDGAAVTVDPVEDRDDADDRAERRRLLSEATVDPAGAVEAARTAVPSGAITGLDLDENGGRAVWDVQFDENATTEQTVTVDAASGEVLGTEVENEDDD